MQRMPPTHQEGGFDPFHEYLCLIRPRHAKDFPLWHALLYGCGERDHQYICLLRCALAHSAYEGLTYTLIESGCEEQQVCILKQLVHNPCGVGIEWSGVVTGALKERTEGAPYHRVCAQDSETDSRPPVSVGSRKRPARVTASGQSRSTDLGMLDCIFLLPGNISRLLMVPQYSAPRVAPRPPLV